MRNPFSPGDTLSYEHVVTPADTARFETGEVHNVYSTFALARDAEWSGRLFLLQMKESGEEGIGVGLSIEHVSPALIDQNVVFTSRMESVEGNVITTSFKAHVGNRLVARGVQKQKLMRQEKLAEQFLLVS